MHAELIDKIATLRHRLAEVRHPGSVIGLVPTMGALHAGHGRLIERARADCTHVVVSIFVNPLQFDREDDLRRYPHSLDADMELCGRLGANIVLWPSVEEMYPVVPECTV